MTDEQKASAIANISDILARNVGMKFEHAAQIIVAWLEEQEKRENSEAKWYSCYIHDESNIVGIAGIRSGDIASVRKAFVEIDNLTIDCIGISIVFGSGAKENYRFDTPEQRDAFFDKIKKELL